MQILKYLLFTILYILFVEIIGGWFYLAEFIGIKDYVGYYYLVSGIIQVGLTFLFILLIKSKNEKLINPTNLNWCILALSIGLLFIFVQTPLNEFYNLFSDYKFEIKYNYDGIEDLKNLNVLAIIFIIPIGEELFFRRYIQKNLQTTFQPIYAILIASILFASIHLPYMALISIVDYVDWSFHWAYIAFFGGLISGILYYKSKSLIPSILMHLGWNLMVTIV